MHFSRPSGHRLSWGWPGTRGAVGRRSSGYWTVSTFRNISWKVTPNPLMGLRKSSTGDLLGAVRVGAGHRVGGGGPRAAGAPAALALVAHGPRARAPPPPPFGGDVPGHRDDDDDGQDHAADHVHGRAVAVEPPGANGGDQQQPDDRDRDQHLPAQRHQLVVADPG